MRVEDPAELLHRHNLRSTPQRRAILGAFAGTVDEHLSAEEVLSRAAATVPEISRGTVYATLAELAELGLLHSVGSPDPVRYEINRAPHDHFRCRQCLRLFDVDLDGASLLEQPLPGFTIELVTVQADGVCADCHAYVRGLEEGESLARREPSLSAVELEGAACGRVPTPIGALALAATGEGIVHLAFDEHAGFEKLDERARSRRGPIAARSRLRDLARTLEAYFEGDRRPLADVIDWEQSGPVRSLVLAAAQRIPYAGSLSYERLGDGMSAYECGLLMGANPMPIIVPCHRVCWGTTRRPGFWVGGAERQAFLQDLESGAPA